MSRKKEDDFLQSIQDYLQAPEGPQKDAAFFRNALSPTMVRLVTALLTDPENPKSEEELKKIQERFVVYGQRMSDALLDSDPERRRRKVIMAERGLQRSKRP